MPNIGLVAGSFIPHGQTSAPSEYNSRESHSSVPAKQTIRMSPFRIRGTSRTVAKKCSFRCNHLVSMTSVWQRRIRVVLCACILCLTWAAQSQGSSGFLSGQASKARSNQFVWRVDLSSFAYPANGTQIQWQRGLNEFDTVGFLSENAVVATFLTEEHPRVPTSDAAVRAPAYRLHALFIDSSNGKVLKTLEWPVNNPHAGIFPRYDGSFVFFSTERIVLYSPDWMEVKEFSLSKLTDARAFLAGIAESPSGKTLLVHFIPNQSVGCIRILTATLDHSEDACQLPTSFFPSPTKKRLSAA